MAKVTRPLFSDEARGPIAGIGSFRMGAHGPEFIAPPKARKAEAQPKPKIRECFKAAKAAHSAIVPERINVNGDWRDIRLPRWPEFWRQWLIDHPDCQD
ncbi:MAG: hypothetical protein RKO66_05435 [Candidatus Contendobacter sp.]|nr:hypothetical protein [Candidatus Contendobacter sp.]MDS4058222.1 hypothetical protein [Candidatus Contendobacter sp.]